MRGIRSGMALALAAAALTGGTAIGSSSVATSHREAIVPSRTPSKKREVHKRKNHTPVNRFRKGKMSKLARRLTRKVALGMNGAF
jgi:hypothetical protein